MTIENYFERRIRPEDKKAQSNGGVSSGLYNNQSGRSSNDSTTTSTTTTFNKTQMNRSSIIDEDQLNRTFQEIVNCINLDDDSEEETSPTTHSASNQANFSRSNLNFHHVHHSLLPEFNSIFGGTKSSFNMVVGSGVNSSQSRSSDSGNSSESPNSSTLGKSFLDEDWFPRGGVSSGNNAKSCVNSSGLIPSSACSSRPITPTSAVISSSPSSSRSNDFYHPIYGNNNFITNPTPSDYICKLCNFGGHWMKDCRLYEPRTPTGSISSFKSSSSNSSNTNSLGSVGSTGPISRTSLPPGNYVCRLCNVAGHWIDQCSKFQPKQHESLLPGNNTSSPPTLPPMLGPGPTPNYRPPAYLSKPVPSNYICNLCHRPGHWIQQCSEFTPIINHKPSIGGNN